MEYCFLTIYLDACKYVTGEIDLFICCHHVVYAPWSKCICCAGPLFFSITGCYVVCVARSFSRPRVSGACDFAQRRRAAVYPISVYSPRYFAITRRTKQQVDIASGYIMGPHLFLFQDTIGSRFVTIFRASGRWRRILLFLQLVPLDVRSHQSPIHASRMAPLGETILGS